MEPTDESTRVLGGWASIFLGVSYLVVGVAFFLQPAAQRPGASADELLTSVADTRGAYLLLNWSFAVGAVIALAAVPAISGVVSRGSGWVRWGRNLAYLGFAVIAVNFFRILTLVPVEADNYVAGTDEAVQAAIRGDFIHLSLDPDGWLIFGAVGVWVLIISINAFREGAAPSLLAAIGIAVAVAYWLVVLGNILGVAELIAVSAGVGGIILAPIFYIWMGLRLRSPSTM